MMEFFYNIGRGIMENKDKIIMILTSGQFASFIVALVGLWKAIRSTRNNTESTKTLSAALTANEKNCEDSALAASNTEELKTFLQKVNEKLDDFEAKIDNKLNVQSEKVNAIIEVQSIVYSSIKDEKVRNTVNNLLVNAKYAETATRAELKKQVVELKNQVAEKTRQLTEFVEQTSNKVAAIVDGSEPADKEEVVERY